MTPALANARTVEAARDRGGRPQSRSSRGIIDCDVHEMMSSPKVLLPYLDEVWHRHLEVTNWGFKLPPLPYVHLQHGGMRGDTRPQEHGYPAGPPGSSYELMNRQLLDAYDIEYAILAGLFHPGIATVQFAYYDGLARAYNEWVMREWLDRDSRFRGSIQVPLHDAEIAAEEIDRCAEHPQMVQVMLPMISTGGGFGRKRYRPIFEAAARNQLAIGFHQTYVTQTSIGHPEFYVEWHVGMNQTFMSHTMSLIFSGVFDEFPDLHVVMLEGGWTWAPYLMWQMDFNYKALKAEVPWLQRLPSEYLREHFLFGTQPMPEPDDPRDLLKVIELFGSEDWLVFASDYPHWDFDDPQRAYPNVLPKELRRKILHENARRAYGARLDPVDVAT